MDVRCEQCKAVYELDEAKLKPAGVTVKCTQCGHLFKVRKRATTNPGPGIVPVPRAPSAELAAEREPTPVPRSAAQPWMVKTDAGEVLTCNELVDLQKWIVSGKVTRTATISRTGQKWKPLSGISELSGFFDIAEDARAASASAEAMRDDHKLGKPQVSATQSGEGPVRGRATDRSGEAAFTGKPGHRFAHLAAEIDQAPDDYESPKKPVARYVVLLSLLILGGAGAAIYFRVFAAGSPESMADAGDLDGGALVDPGADAGLLDMPTPPPPGPIIEVRDVTAPVYSQNETELLALLSEVSVPGADPTTPVSPPDLVAAGRLNVALAQLVADGNAPGNQAELLAAAEAAARKVLEVAPEDPGAMLVLAEAMRLNNRPSREIERNLRKAQTAEQWFHEAAVSRAMLYLRDQRMAEARQLLNGLVRTAPAADSRPHYLLALVDFAEGQNPAAEEQLKMVLTRSPGHVGAQKLLQKLANPGAEPAAGVDSTDPLPPEADAGGAALPADAGAAPAATPTPPPPPKPEGYEQLLAKADRLAENGSCGAATAQYKNALDKNPKGTGALTGLAYCYLDAKKHDEALGMFQRALQTSPRYQPAMWGIAEAYQSKGDNERAVTAYKDFMREHPEGRRAEMARRQIERLGGTL